MDKLQKQLAFIIEIDRLKGVLRQSIIVDGSRRENSAEHSWHLAMMALILYEHANEPVDVSHVIRLVLVHDIVEIDAGDAYAYDPEANNGKFEREQLAAGRIFGLLPDEQKNDLIAVWQEFEARQTAEAKFANAIDRVMPLIHNITSNGKKWKENGVTVAQVRRRMAPVIDGSVPLARYVEQLIEEAIANGYLEI